MTDSAAPATHGNLFAGRLAAGSEEIFDTLFASANCRVERIVSFGHASPPGFWYEQDEDEWVVLLAGSAVLAFAEGRRLAMQAGDWVSLPARCRHRVETVSDDALWLAVHCRADSA
ncbi:MAG TPA: phosphoribosylaminoimidazole carboxylase [Thauera sp.]|nr:phosphoribosylaminoimidazole carboxylase [Thauera sp.]HHW64159.1 cupin domain-containing protein [Rhodocyclaceae bacterium]